MLVHVSKQLLTRVGRGQASSMAAAAARWQSSATTVSPFANYEMAPFDPIIGLNEEFQRDTFAKKVNVGVGAYRDDAGKPYVLPCVRTAEERMLAKHLDMEYSNIVSFWFDWDFNKMASGFVDHFGGIRKRLTHRFVLYIHT